MINAIVPVSGSADQYQGIAMAKSLAEAINVSIALITVVGDNPDQAARDAELANAALFLKQQSAQFPDGAIVRQLVRSGDPVDEILSLVDQTPGSFLVLSPRWADEIRSFMPDSLSERLMHASNVPVLLSTTDRWPRSLTLDNIMIPVTHSTPTSSQILQLNEAVGQHQSVFRLVYITNGQEPESAFAETAPPPRAGTAEERAGYQARWRLLELASDLRSHGVRSTWELRYGQPAQELSRAATTTGANLIVFHAETSDLYSAGTSDQIALRVSHDAATPVLLIPTKYQLPSVDFGPAHRESASR